MAKILIVDDEPVIRMMVEMILQKDGHRVVMAEDGAEAIDMCARERPDLVLMDIMMPTMDGYEATRRLKNDPELRELLPIIFLTGVESSRNLAQCLDCGGDDFVTKPINGTILRARIRAWLRRVELTEKLAFERQSVEEVILKMRSTPSFDPRGIRLLVTPVERTAGDFLFSASRKDGVQHVMLGDFTGHGLPAAIGGPLVSNIFYSMTAKGFQPEDILNEINLKVHEQIPAGMFLAACFIAIDRNKRRARVWNGGLPEVLLFRRARLFHRIRSVHPALGVRVKNRIDETVETLHLEAGDRIISCSDGIAESRNPQGEMFGQEAVETLLARILSRDAPIQTLQEALEAFRGQQTQADDITLVEVS